MKAEKVIFAANLASAEFTPHPLQKHLTFIFTDFHPNGNKQAIPRSEAENILRTALNMPVKVHFAGTPKGHQYSEPVGTITRLWQQDEKVFAQAVLWANEFPDVADYVQSAFKDKTGVQFSWELYYDEDEVDDGGVQWLKGIVAAAATIVDNPAYQGRTPLTALAEGMKMNELEELKAKLEEAQSEITNLKVKLETAEAEKTQLETSKSELEVENQKFVEFKKTIEAEAKRLTNIDSLKTKLSTAGIKMSDEDFENRVETLLAMSEDVLDLYIKDMSAKVPAIAEKKNDPIIPDRLIESNNNKAFEIPTLAEAWREAKRAGRID